MVLIYKHDAQILNLRIHNPSTEQSNQKCIVFLLNNSPFNTAKLIADICLANLVFHLHELHAFAAQAFGKLQPLLTLFLVPTCWQPLDSGTVPDNICDSYKVTFSNKLTLSLQFFFNFFILKPPRY